MFLFRCFFETRCTSVTNQSEAITASDLQITSRPPVPRIHRLPIHQHDSILHFDQSRQYNYDERDDSESLSSITSASFSDENGSSGSDVKNFEKLVDIVLTRL